MQEEQVTYGGARFQRRQSVPVDIAMKDNKYFKKISLINDQSTLADTLQQAKINRMSKDPTYPSTKAMEMPQVVGKMPPSAPQPKSDRDPPPSAQSDETLRLGGTTQEGTKQ